MQRLPRLRVAGLTMLAVSVVVSAACAARSINSVLADPSRYRTREVKLAGTVTESFSVVERGAYLLDDNTGQLWVVSSSSTPRKGARVTVKGTIREGFNLGSLGDLLRLPGAASGIVLIESSRDANN
jgi:membrane protein implicated in regulation of membrane protease activity